MSSSQQGQHNNDNTSNSSTPQRPPLHEIFPEWDFYQGPRLQDQSENTPEDQQMQETQQQHPILQLGEPTYLVPSQSDSTLLGHDNSPLRLHPADFTSTDSSFAGQLQHEIPSGGTQDFSLSLESPMESHVEADSSGLMSTVVHGGSSSATRGALPSPLSMPVRRPMAARQHGRAPYARPQGTQPGQARNMRSTITRREYSQFSLPQSLSPSSNQFSPQGRQEGQQHQGFPPSPSTYEQTQGFSPSLPAATRVLQPSVSQSAGRGGSPLVSSLGHFRYQSQSGSQLHRMYMTTDMSYDPEAQTLTASIECPGIRTEDLKVTLSTCLHNHVKQVSVRATSAPTLPEEATTSHTASRASEPMILCRERKYGELYRTFPVRAETTMADVSASANHGLLTLRIKCGAPALSTNEVAIPVARG